MQNFIVPGHILFLFSNNCTTLGHKKDQICVYRSTYIVYIKYELQVHLVDNRRIMQICIKMYLNSNNIIVLAGIELIFVIKACMMLCVGVFIKIAMMTH